MPPLDDGFSFRSIPRRPPQVPHVSFPPSTCHFYYKRFRVVIGLRLVLQPYPRLQPVNDFCSSGQRFALGLVGSPNPASFRFHLNDVHPCLRLCPSHYRADSGLAPVRNVRRWAHIKKEPGEDEIHLRPALPFSQPIIHPAAADTHRSPALPSLLSARSAEKRC